MKKQTFNSQELGLISLSYMKELFPKPKTGELLIDGGDGQGSFTFYYNNEYYDRYCKAIINAAQSGKFAKSNSEKDWNSLLIKVSSAVDCNPNLEELRKYWLSED